MSTEAVTTQREWVTVSAPEDIWFWVFFLMGATSQAAFVDSGDKERDARSRWAALNLGRLIPAVTAALTVAFQHPEEFQAALGSPIQVERMP